jgi:hypothetical protein
VPWKETRAVDSRMELVVRIRAGERVSDLCREYGIFVERFAARGPEGLLDQSRARHTQNHRTSAEVVERIVKLKKEHPSWGSKKLKEFLEREDKGVRFPSRSTIDVILCRSGLVKPRRMRREVPPTLGPLTIPEGPNHVWAVDYKGQFRLGNGRLCNPLTCSDLSSLRARLRSARQHRAGARPRGFRASVRSVRSPRGHPNGQRLAVRLGTEPLRAFAPGAAPMSAR